MIKKEGRITYEEEGETLVVRVRGEIDHHGAVGVRTEIDARILQSRPERVLLELSAVDFMDSSGLGLIMGRLALMKRCGGELALLDPGDPVLKIVRLAGMERMVGILRTKIKTEG